MVGDLQGYSKVFSDEEEKEVHDEEKDVTKPSSEEVEKIVDEEDEDIQNTTMESSLSHFAYLIVKRALPVCTGYVFYSLNGTITMVFAGHLRTDSDNANAVFAGISLANMFVAVSYLSLILGMSSAIETLASQNYGAGNYTEVGIVLQRSVLISTVIAIPLLISWFYSKHIFVSFGIEESVATVIQTYLTFRMFSVPNDLLMVSYEKYLAAIGVVKPELYANISQNIVLIFCNYLFIHVLRFNYKYLAVSYAISAWASGFVLILTSYNDPAVKKTIQPLNIEAFSKWKEFVMLGIQATLMICSEWWAYEILTFMASLLGTSEAASQSVILQIAAMAYMIPMGVGISTASLVGNFIGANKLDVAKRIGKFAIQFDFCLQILVATIIFFFGKYLIFLFTDSSDVRSICTLAIPFLCAFTLVDALLAVGGGILRGSGKQTLGAISNIISFYGVGIPFAYYFCFSTSLRVRGLMMGISVGAVCQFVVLYTIIFFFEDYVYKPVVEIQGESCVEENSNKFKVISVEDEDDEEIGFHEEDKSSFEMVKFPSLIRNKNNQPPQ